jgi:hypothetical protein
MNIGGLFKLGLWSQARTMAGQTPESRNRYVDFLRALSILAVISGHWLMAAPHVIDGNLAIANMLELEPWTRWLTWGFQVMPVFFLVGGYANGVSWNAATRDGLGYSEWLASRLGRLIKPVLPLVLAWVLIGGVGNQIGVRAEILSVASQVALVPIWFLSVYIVVALLVPLTWGAWRRYGMASFWVLALLAIVDDALFFAFGLRDLGWLNYAFVWLAVHQLGYAWRDGRITGVRNAVTWAIGGMVLLFAMVYWGPYPIGMVSVPGEDVSNTLPPKFAMLALGVTQMGILLALESPVQRWLSRLGPWTATLLVNGMIMTIYLWHLTASTLVVGLALVVGNIGLEVDPGTSLWWSLRPVWLLVYVAALGLLAPAFSRLERGAGSTAGNVTSWRLVLGAMVACSGLALLALDGVVGTEWLGLRIYVLCLPFLGAYIAGVIRIPRRPPNRA